MSDVPVNNAHQLRRGGDSKCLRNGWNILRGQVKGEKKRVMQTRSEKQAESSRDAFSSSWRAYGGRAGTQAALMNTSCKALGGCPIRRHHWWIVMSHLISVTMVTQMWLGPCECDEGIEMGKSHFIFFPRTSWSPIRAQRGCIQAMCLGLAGLEEMKDSFEWGGWPKWYGEHDSLRFNLQEECRSEGRRIWTQLWLFAACANCQGDTRSTFWWGLAGWGEGETDDEMKRLGNRGAVKWLKDVQDGRNSCRSWNEKQKTWINGIRGLDTE